MKMKLLEYMEKIDSSKITGTIEETLEYKMKPLKHTIGKKIYDQIGIK